MRSVDLPTGRTGQAVAAFITLLAALLLWGGLTQPLLGWYQQRAQRLQEQQAMADRMQRLADSLPALRRAVQRDASNRQPTPALLGGDSDSVAGAALQEQVQAMASAAATTLSSIETLPAQRAGAWRRIALRVTLTAPWPDLVHLLNAVEAANPRMLVDDLHMHATVVPTSTTEIPLQASFVVYAFRAADGAKEAVR